MKDLKIVTVDELHSSIRSFIVDSKTVIGDYEDMKSLILTMIKAGYMFNMNRDRLRDAMEDLTFMLCPDDDANKDRVERGLEYDDDDDSDSDSDISCADKSIIDLMPAKRTRTPPGGTTRHDHTSTNHRSDSDPIQDVNNNVDDNNVDDNNIEDGIEDGIEDIGQTKDLN